MGTLQFADSRWDSRSSENSLTAWGPYCVDMLSVPAPMPISIMPVLMALAMSTQAWRPEEHWRFSDLHEVVTGKPAARAAARNSVAPPPGARTVPTEMSSTRLGSIFERSRSALKAPTRRSADWVSLKPPFPPLVKGVRRAHVTTTFKVVSQVFPIYDGVEVWRASVASSSLVAQREKKCTHIIGMLLQQARLSLLARGLRRSAHVVRDLRETLLRCIVVRPHSHLLQLLLHIPLLGAWFAMMYMMNLR
jgi:hypothetical protein